MKTHQVVPDSDCAISGALYPIRFASVTASSPTAIALLVGNVLVLEYLHTAVESRREWLPRVRKIASDGTETLIATIDRRD
ncbi:MAG TPA: hypothetical protein VE135_21570 [Pyrinomonadaceae bacterium]|nr:hypothetical protein [Pyrinomonadaceae bacterium]